jgi:hypothetical protein
MLPDALYANVETPSPSLRRTCAFPSPYVYTAGHEPAIAHVGAVTHARTVRRGCQPVRRRQLEGGGGISLDAGPRGNARN